MQIPVNSKEGFTKEYMEKALAEKIIQTGLDSHADFVEIFECLIE